MERIKELEQLILKHKSLYYQGTPEIDDDAYDRLEEELRRLDKNNKILSTVGGVKSTLPKVSHDTKMLSLAKVSTLSDLEKWRKNRDVISMYKVDGMSCSLVYREGRLLLAKTRGDGHIGENITSKAKQINDIPKKIPDTLSLDIRGELFCTQENFSGLCKEMESIGLDRPTNQRNIVAGLILRKGHIELSRYLSFCAFDILSLKKFKTEIDKMDYLKKLNFKILDRQIHRERSTIEDVISQAKEFMADGSFAIDGLVFTFNDINLQKDLGHTGHHPRYKMAYKYKSKTKITVIQEIAWQVSRNGILVPVASINPVTLSGAEIKRVSLHHYGMVKKHQLKKGDQIEITRSGEVIPKFLSVKKKGPGKQTVTPTKCPSCGKKVVVCDIRIVCKNKLCPQRLHNSILNFISKIGIDDLNKKRLAEMIDKGPVKNIPDLYKLTINDILSLDKTKETLAKKLYKAIGQSKKTTLTTFLSSLGIQGGAYNRCEKIVQSGFDTIDKVLDLNVDQLSSIEGFAKKSATDFLSSLSQKKKLIRDLIKMGFTFEISPKKSGFFLGKRVCITGSLSEKRSLVEDRMRKKGALVVKSVSNKTDILVTNNPQGTSAKLKKAKELGVSIMSEKELMPFLDE